MNVNESSASFQSRVARWGKIVIVLVIAGLFYSYVVYASFFRSSSDGEPSNLVSETLSPLPPCSEEYTFTPADKTVILRVDDIQAYAWRETQLKLIEEANSRSIPLVLGVIPNVIATDPEIVTLLRASHCLHEVALHGYDHGKSNGNQTPEFATTTEVEAYQRIKLGIEELAAIGFPKPTTWIPPRNQHSTGTVAALKQHGFTALSTEGDGEHDYDTTVTDYDFDELVPPEVIVAACERTFLTESECIIMIHPQDFATGPDHDERLYQTYFIALLDQLEAADYTFARFSDLESGE